MPWLAVFFNLSWSEADQDLSSICGPGGRRTSRPWWNTAGRYAAMHCFPVYIPAMSRLSAIREPLETFRIGQCIDFNGHVRQARIMRELLFVGIRRLRLFGGYGHNGC